MTTKTLDFLRNTILDFVEPNQKFTLQEILQCISEPSWDSCYDGRTDEESRKACIRRDLQILRDENFITFVDNDGTYLLNNVSEDFETLDEEFDTKESWGEDERNLELIRMKKMFDLGEMPLPRGRGITVVGDPNILRIDQIIDHDEAVKLGIIEYQQKREGDDVDLNRVKDIKESRRKDGYLLGVAPLPAVSKLKPREGAPRTKPFIGSDGKLKTHVLRNGRHRYLGEDEFIRIFEIDAEHEDFLELFGTTANNPFGAIESVGVTTKADAIAGTRMWMKKGRIEIIKDQDTKNLKAISKFLEKNYPHIRNRVVVAREILELEGVRCSIKPYYMLDVADKASKIGNFVWGHDYDKKIARFNFVLNSSDAVTRATEEVLRFKADNEGWKVEVYASLNNTPNGRAEEVTPNNINQLRRKQIDLFNEAEDYYVKFANQKRRGKIEPTKFIFVPQDNENEDFNSFY